MNSFAALLAPLALLIPASIADAPSLPAMPGEGALHLAAESGTLIGDIAFDPESQPPLELLSEAPRPANRAQVRIEQTVILRISPRPAANQREILSQLPKGRSNGTHIEERKIGSCLPAQGIAGVGTTKDNRLLLFMRDRRIIAATLEKACNADDFYSGFYVERKDDGQLCVKRDKVHSRAGAKCQLKQIRQLVAVRD